MAALFARSRLRSDGYCVIDVPDLWWGGYAHYPHIALAEALRVIIWDRTNIVNRIGIFGYPGVMGATFELLTALPRPCRKMRICGFGKESAPCSPRGRPLRTATVRSTFAR